MEESCFFGLSLASVLAAWQGPSGWPSPFGGWGDTTWPTAKLIDALALHHGACSGGVSQPDSSGKPVDLRYPAAFPLITGLIGILIERGSGSAFSTAGRLGDPAGELRVGRG